MSTRTQKQIFACELKQQREGNNMGTVVERATMLGAVDQFAAACLDPIPQMQLTLSQVFEHYVGWCRRTEMAPLRLAEFYPAFEQLAEDVGIPRQQRGANVVYRDVGLRSEQETQEPGTTATVSGTVTTS